MSGRGWIATLNHASCTNCEQQLIQDYNNQGITQDYSQYGANFWGRSADNNYGFGTSDIESNIENVINLLIVIQIMLGKK